jgi:hypothetical protein
LESARLALTRDLTEAEKTEITNLVSSRQAASEALQENITEADALRNAFDLTGASIVQHFDNIGDAAHQLLQQIIAIIVQLEIMKPIIEGTLGKAGTTLGSGSGSGIFGNIVSGLSGLLGFAGGGNPPVGRASIVGENGPEVFVPRVPGTIIPNGAAAAQPMKIVLAVQPSGEFDARVAGVSRQAAAQVVVQYDRGLPRRVRAIADDPWRS